MQISNSPRCKAPGGAARRPGPGCWALSQVPSQAVRAPIRYVCCVAPQATAAQPAQRRVIFTAAGIEPGAAADANPLAEYEEPDTSQDAIDQGLILTGAGRWEQALGMFEKALSLPGTGVKRFRDKPRAASDRERMTALYNIACCHSQLGDVRSGLVALAGSMEVGYADFAQMRRDPDLAALRADERFEGLLKRFEPTPVSAFLGFDLNGLFGRK